MNEEGIKNLKDIPIDDGDDHGSQSSPRGVLEITVSCTDSDYSRGSSFNEKSPATDSGGDEDGDGGGDGGGVSQGLRWRNLVSNLKLMSLRMFSKKRLGLRCDGEVAVDGGGWAVTKPSWRNFTFDELAAATDGFSHDNLVGRGGHAEVYKGCLPDGQLVAVKKITKREKKDEARVGDFLSELGIIAHINHPNAARLIGFSSDTDLHLVLQFAPHGSLATLLHSMLNVFIPRGNQKQGCKRAKPQPAWADKLTVARPVYTPNQNRATQTMSFC